MKGFIAFVVVTVGFTAVRAQVFYTYSYAYGCSPYCPVTTCEGAYVPQGQCCLTCPNCAAVSCITVVPPCDNPRIPPGGCCPVCPSAPAGFCLANNLLYAAGQSYRQSCNTCQCRADGTTMCTYIQCATDNPCAGVRCGSPPCTNPVTPTGSCCPVCTRGCNVNGIVYREGQPVPCGNICTTCVCRSGNIQQFPSGLCSQAYSYGYPYLAVRG